MIQMSTVAFLLASFSAIVHVNGHGYLESPRSRNFVASQDGQWSGNDISTPKAETCPHCLNGGGGLTSGQCGITGNVNYDFPPNVLGTVMPQNIQATYVRGQNITVKVHITAHHKGHFEFSVCPIGHGEAPTRECFRSNRLQFVSDPKYGANKDTNYPYRAYIPPSTLGPMDYEFQMKLPQNVTGDYVMLQWWWVSANSCEPAGYSEYNFPEAWGPMRTSLPLCGVQPDGTITGAEQFWNCAEIQILDDASPTPPETTVPTSSPTLAPENPPTPTPTPAPTMQNTQNTLAPTSNPVLYGNYCGSSWFDAAKCGIPCPTGNSTVCASNEHCYAGVACSIGNNPTNPPTASPTSPPVNDSDMCGDGNIGNGNCPDPTHCCSKWGYCGTGDAYCGSGSSNGRRLLRRRI